MPAIHGLAWCIRHPPSDVYSPHIYTDDWPADLWLYICDPHSKAAVHCVNPQQSCAASLGP
eukprot:scaffold6895_cov21-Tisochrysis_lutea.AAC.1